MLRQITSVSIAVVIASISIFAAQPAKAHSTYAQCVDWAYKNANGNSAVLEALLKECDDLY